MLSGGVPAVKCDRILTKEGGHDTVKVDAIINFAPARRACWTARPLCDTLLGSIERSITHGQATAPPKDRQQEAQSPSRPTETISKTNAHRAAAPLEAKRLQRPIAAGRRRWAIATFPIGGCGARAVVARADVMDIF